MELVQLEQLRCLIQHHGLRRIHAEGLTRKDLAVLEAKVSALRKAEKQVPALEAQLEEVRQLRKDMAANGKESTERYRQTGEIEREIVGLLQQHRLDLLEFGVAGRLLVLGEIEELLPLDDGELLERAKPVRGDGQVEMDPKAVKARQDAQVKLALEKGPFALIILGGAHDLSSSVQRLPGGDCEYFRVTIKRYQEFSANGLR